MRWKCDRWQCFPESSRNCYLRSESRLIVGLGIENLIVVETNDAVLIANPAYGQEVKM